MVYVRNSHAGTACAVTKHADLNATACSVCDLVTKDLVRCRNNHAFCIEDFSSFIKVDITSFRQRFISNECRLYCPECSPLMSPSQRCKDGDFARKCASQLSDEVYSSYEAAITETAVIAAQQECELRFLRASKPASQDPDEDTIGKMML